MSEKFPESRPVLVPHNKEVQVWNLLADREDENGNPIVQSPEEEKIDGVFGRAEKSALPGALSEDVQAGLAQILAMDRNPTAEQLERGSNSQAVIEELGEQALTASMRVEGNEQLEAVKVSLVDLQHLSEVPDLTAIEEIEELPSAEAAPESAVEGLEAKIQEFSEYINQAEAGVRAEILEYKDGAAESINSLKRSGENSLGILWDMKSAMDRASYGESNHSSALMNVARTLDNVRHLIINDQKTLAELGGSSTQMRDKLDTLENSQLAQKKANFTDVTSDRGQDVLSQASRLDQSFISKLETLGRIRSDVSGAEDANLSQLTYVNRIFDMVDRFGPLAHQGRLGSGDFDDLNNTIAVLRSKIDENNSYGFKKISGALEELDA